MQRLIAMSVNGAGRSRRFESFSRNRGFSGLGLFLQVLAIDFGCGKDRWRPGKTGNFEAVAQLEERKYRPACLGSPVRVRSASLEVRMVADDGIAVTRLLTE